MPLARGQIIDTNSLMLQQLLATEDVDVTVLPPLSDNYKATCDTLVTHAARRDVILITGGVSVGDRDYVRHAIADISTVHFWRLAIRPGKPVIFGQIGPCLMMGLPGNPVSAMVTFQMIFKPLLAALRGGRAALSPAYLLPIAEDYLKDTPLRCLPRARLVNMVNGMSLPIMTRVQICLSLP